MPQSSKAADKDGLFAIRGIGQISCANFQKAYVDGGTTLALAAGWIDGYVTATSRYTQGTFAIMPWQRVELLLDLLNGHCERNPDQPLSRAVQLMIEAMAPLALAEKSEIQRIDIGEGQSLEIYEDVLRDAQARLKELGHYNSTVDGAFGPGTAAAFRAFQATIDLPETGFPDQATLLALFESRLNQ